MKIKPKVSNMDAIRGSRNLNELRRVVSSIDKAIKAEQTQVELLSVSAGKRHSAQTFDHVAQTEKGDTVRSLIDNFVPPDANEVKNHTDTLSRLYERLGELHAIAAFIRHSFFGIKGSEEASSAVLKLISNTTALVSRAFSSLNKLTKDSMPPDILSIREGIVSWVIEHIDTNKYDNLQKETYVQHLEEQDVWQYTSYIQLENLKNEQGFIVKDFNIVFIASIDSKGIVEHYISTISEFQLPSKLTRGKSFTDLTQLKQYLPILLQHIDNINVLHKQTININPKDLKNGSKDLKLLANAEVLNDTIVLTLTEKDAPQTARNDFLAKVLPLIRHLTGSGRKGLTPTINYDNKGRRDKIRINLVSTNKTHNVQIDKLYDLQHALDLTDEQVETIKQALSR